MHVVCICVYVCVFTYVCVCGTHLCVVCECGMHLYVCVWFRFSVTLYVRVWFVLCLIPRQAVTTVQVHGAVLGFTELRGQCLSRGVSVTHWRFMNC